jgi:hypothetical protein
MLGLPPAPAAAQPVTSAPMEVTSDTAEFCQSLVRHFERTRMRRPEMSADRILLASKGEHMCAIGLIRAGIARLRMALRGVHEPQ